jgi:hypothetical protein
MSMDFNGTSAYIKYASSPDVSPPFSVAMWFRQPSNSYGLLWSNHLPFRGDGAHVLNKFSGGTIAVESNDAANGWAGATTTATITSNIWQHTAGVFTSASSRSIYLNGGNKVTNTATRNPAAGRTAEMLGVSDRVGLSGYFTGQMAHFARWNVALTDDEVLSLYEGANPLLIRPASIVRYTPYMGRDSSTIDIVGGIQFTQTATALSPEEPRVLWPWRTP